MPVLRKYKNRDDYYILTSLNGAIVTFQLTSDGFYQLEQSGVSEGIKFNRALLLELFKTGDVFTRAAASDIDLSGWVQTTLDFSDDPEPESSIPVCASCGSPYALHLVSCHEPDKDAYLSIRCGECCISQRPTIGICLPLPALTRPLFKRLLGLCAVAELDPSVQSYQKLLEHSFMEKLKRGKAPVRPVQSDLFQKAEPEQVTLL